MFCKGDINAKITYIVACVLIKFFSAYSLTKAKVYEKTVHKFILGCRHNIRCIAETDCHFLDWLLNFIFNHLSFSDIEEFYTAIH